MIRCLPKGLCSWDYRLDGDGHRASLEFRWLSEQGTITVDGARFDVRKQGLASGRWTLLHDALQVASAEKTSMFTRKFRMEDPDGELLIRAASPFSRIFRIERSGEVLARIYPDHAFTRRAKIDAISTDLDFISLSFAFWLVAILWRRAANSSNGAAAGG